MSHICIFETDNGRNIFETEFNETSISDET
jgi:hypothetical protein